MPAKSKSQFKLFKGICVSPSFRARMRKRGIKVSKAKACEMVRGQSPKKLPKRKRKKTSKR